MEIIPKDAGLFKSAIDALKDFLPTAQLRISEAGIAISGMDVSHIGFVDFLLAAADCTVLSVPRPITIGIQTAVLARTLAAVGPTDRVTLGYKKDTLTLSYTNAKASKKAVFEMPTLDIDDSQIELPDVSYDATIVTKTTDIAAVIKEVGVFGDSITLRLDEEGFHVSAEGDAGTVRQTLENTEDRDMTLLVEDGADSTQASFGTKYITGIMKGGAPLSSTTRLEFGVAKPMRASFHFGSESHFIAYLAPKCMEE